MSPQILEKFNCENIDKICLSRDFLSNKNIHIVGKLNISDIISKSSILKSVIF